MKSSASNALLLNSFKSILIELGLGFDSPGARGTDWAIAMKIAVLGGGVIGVTTAYYLANAGHQVTVIDRQRSVALETSFANAGEVSPGYASPWGAPGVPTKAMRWLFMKHAPLIIKPGTDPAMLSWLFAMLRNCSSARYAENKRRMALLAHYSRAQLEALRETTGISYDEQSKGTLQLFRKQAELDGIVKDTELLKQDGVPFELLDRNGCIAAEPGLAYASAKIVGGLRLPGDETGDCYKFTAALAARAEACGVAFRFGEAVTRLVCSQGRVVSADTDIGSVNADAFVIAMGSYSPNLVRPLGISLPIYPVKGYSITASVVDGEKAPRSTLLDESFKVAITRLGDRIRVGGMAELSGFSHDLPNRRRQTLLNSLTSLFPGAAELSDLHFWSGLRPMTPDGPPVIGQTPLSGLYLNTGHGTLGWTMACGSARVLSDMISGKPPEIETTGFLLARYRR